MLNSNELSFLKRTKTTFIAEGIITDGYVELYENYAEELSIIFSSLHDKLNSFFAYLNNQYWNKYCHADKCREILKLITYVDTILNSIETSKIILDNYYKEVLRQIKLFVKPSGGATMPEDFKQIEIIEIKPIFSDTSSIRKETTSFSLQRIGNGSYATVYKYYDKFYDETFVVKKANDNLDEKELIRFKKEFEIMKSLNSLFITKVYTFNPDKNEYTMEFLDYTLDKYLKNFKKSMTILNKIKLINQILRAFEFINSNGYLHRDISPNNILIKSYPNMPIVKLSDFGLVKEKESTLTSINSEIRGSLNDWSGLQKKGYSNYDVTDETFALTRLIVYIIEGYVDNYHKLKNQGLKDFLNKGMSPNAENRFQSLEELKMYFNGIKNDLTLY